MQISIDEANVNWKFLELYNNELRKSRFSLNSSIMVEDLHEESLVTQQLVYDLVKSHGGIKKIDTIPVNDKMLEIVKDSNKNYKVALDKKEEADNLARKRKKEMIKEVEKKKDYC